MCVVLWLSLGSTCICWLIDVGSSNQAFDPCNNNWDVMGDLHGRLQCKCTKGGDLYVLGKFRSMGCYTFNLTCHYSSFLHLVKCLFIDFLKTFDSRPTCEQIG